LSNCVGECAKAIGPQIPPRLHPGCEDTGRVRVNPDAANCSFFAFYEGRAGSAEWINYLPRTADTQFVKDLNDHLLVKTETDAIPVVDLSIQRLSQHGYT
jgi:hypothetical protein